jgi:hypothetical protein
VSRTINVCCNSATAEGLEKPLRLEYRPTFPQRNVRLGLPRFIRHLGHIPARTLDLLELAAYIYAADRYVSRGSRDAVEFQSWSREFKFRVRVRDVGFWARADLQDALRSCLTFMTGDADFAFEFAGGHDTPPTSLFDREGLIEPAAGGDQQAVLFSGGLDSLGGAVELLETTDSSLILVSHQSQVGTKKAQTALARALSNRYPGRVTPYGFECTLSGTRAVEETQRSRSFLYAAIGFAVARAHHTGLLTIYENGVTSLNLRRREDLANARASRTTHPHALEGVERVLSLVGGRPFTIETPAFWLTKRDVVERLIAARCGDLIASSVSCSRTYQRSGPATHCGRCFQCVDRRLSMLAAGEEQLDDAALYEVDITRQAIPDEESRTTTIDYLRQAAEFADSSVDSFANEYASEIADALDAVPMVGTDLERTERVWKLVRRHGENVRRALVRARDLYDDPLKPLPTGSLISLVSFREHLRPAVIRLAAAISKMVSEAIRSMFQVEGPTSEADLNAKLSALIGSHHELISEHPAVRFACARATPDHMLVDFLLLVEAKFIREGTPPAKASEGIAADLTKYPSESHILFLVYDPLAEIRDDYVFRRDIESKGRCTVTLLR